MLIETYPVASGMIIRKSTSAIVYTTMFVEDWYILYKFGSDVPSMWASASRANELMNKRVSECVGGWVVFVEGIYI